jgi:hypothetical protein
MAADPGGVQKLKDLIMSPDISKLNLLSMMIFAAMLKQAGVDPSNFGEINKMKKNWLAETANQFFFFCQKSLYIIMNIMQY